MPELIRAIQDALKGHPEFQTGPLLILDESADQKAGEHSVSAGRQHSGRLGKIELSQVGVFLTLATVRAHTWLDGELFIPEHWFEEGYREQRQRAGISEERTFQSKPELGWQIIQLCASCCVPLCRCPSYRRKRRLT